MEQRVDMDQVALDIIADMDQVDHFMAVSRNRIFFKRLFFLMRQENS